MIPITLFLSNHLFACGNIKYSHQIPITVWFQVLLFKTSSLQKHISLIYRWESYVLLLRVRVDLRVMAMSSRTENSPLDAEYPF